ncbi:hypothetical protein NPIL_302381, partial [Nephila pilipes]
MRTRPPRRQENRYMDRSDFIKSDYLIAKEAKEEAE